eukprot:scaffold101235_cov36-Phaeocystis_antarctica.AAC.1
MARAYRHSAAGHFLIKAGGLSLPRCIVTSIFVWKVWGEGVREKKHSRVSTKFGRVKGGVSCLLSLDEQAVGGRQVAQVQGFRKVRDEGRRVVAIALLDEDEAAQPLLVGPPPANVEKATPRVVRHGVRHATSNAK